MYLKIKIIWHWVNSFSYSEGCGKANAANDRIVGGSEATPNEFPWVVAVSNFYFSALFAYFQKLLAWKISNA